MITKLSQLPTGVQSVQRKSVPTLQSEARWGQVVPSTQGETAQRGEQGGYDARSRAEFGDAECSAHSVCSSDEVTRRAEVLK